MLSKIWKDFRGLWSVCGPRVAIWWVCQIALHLPICIRSRNLAWADFAMGEGPYRVRRSGRSARLAGALVISHIRELWVRNVYLSGGLLSLSDDVATVVDLGGNRGYFTALAALESPAARIVTVEPSRSYCDAIAAQVKLNGWSERVSICNAFIGGATMAQKDTEAIPDALDVSYISEADFMERYALERVDFLKCDIEGSEFDLLKPGSRLLKAARQLAIELHGHAGSLDDFTAMLRAEGFQVHVHSDSGGSAIVHAKKN
jgi:FkbM family methyltransferase